MVIYTAGDGWWPATVVLFAPRWILAAPLFILVPLAVLKDPYSVLPLTIAAVIVLGPLMGLCLNLQKTHPTSGNVVRILTCNVNANNFNRSKLSNLIKEYDPHIISLQECPSELKLDLSPDWNMICQGGLGIFSRFNLNLGRQRCYPHESPRAWFLQCHAMTPWGRLTFLSVHLPSPRYALQAVIDRHLLLNPSRKRLLMEETDLREAASMEASSEVYAAADPVIIAGDFNMPVESSIYRKFWSGFTNAFSKGGMGYGWTWREEVKGIKMGVRIDHVLVKKGTRVLNCKVGPDIGSDHRPLLAEVEF
jgi:endonuclease/exonuclease/phosphatase (EEP) superfamily protein YafD